MQSKFSAKIVRKYKENLSFSLKFKKILILIHLLFYLLQHCVNDLHWNENTKYLASCMSSNGIKVKLLVLDE